MNKYYNPKTKKTEDLFENLNSVYSVYYSNPEDDQKNPAVYITIEAEDENDAKIKAMNNDEFTAHIDGKHYDRKYLKAHKPRGLYVIGKVEYYDGSSKL